MVSMANPMVYVRNQPEAPGAVPLGGPGLELGGPLPPPAQMLPPPIAMGGPIGAFPFQPGTLL